MHESALLRFAENAADTGVRILDERSGITVEINGFLGIEEHLALRIHLDDEILECTEAYHAIEFLLLLVGKTLELAGFLGCRLGLLVHLFDEVVSVDDGSLARFHLALGQFNHSVGQMVDAVGPLEAELLEDKLEDGEMVVLLVTDDIDMGVKTVLGEAAFRRAEVLGDVDRSSVGTEDELAVEAVCSQVAPYGAVRVTDKRSILQSFLYKLLTQQVSVMLVIDLVERDTQSLVGLVEPVEYPAVHHGPKVADFLVAFLPLDQHFMHGLHAGGFFLGGLLIHSCGNKFLHLAGKDVVELDIAVSDEVVTLLTGTLRSGAGKRLLPCIHGFADMHAAVVDKRHLDDVVAAGLEQAGNGIAEEIVADVTEMERLVGVR